MLDFTSSLYLGLTHPASRLPAWTSLTSGRPAALYQPPAHREIAERLARLVGVPAARLTTSTLHAFVDLAAALAELPGEARLAADVAAYPIGRIGLASVSPTRRVERLAHFDLVAARRWASPHRGGGRPVILVDGWCPGCGRVAPVAELRTITARNGGLLVVDDTQAVGLLGPDGDGAHSWGNGGGGSVARSGISDGVVVVASLAKALGAPLAVIAGPAPLVAASWRRGPTVAHASPPSIPAGLAAKRALDLNDEIGEARRRRLLSLVIRLRHRLAGDGLEVQSGLFPVVRVPVASGQAALQAVAHLARSGVRAVALGPSCQGHPALGLSLSSAHRDADVDHVAALVTHFLRKAA